MLTHTVSPIWGQPSLIPIEAPFFSCLCLPPRAWLNQPKKSFLLWPLQHPHMSKKEKKKDPLSQPVAILTAHFCHPEYIIFLPCPVSLRHSLRPPLPLPTPQHNVSIKEIGGVELLSWIRHGQCGFGWTKPPQGQEGERLNRMGMWWQNASVLWCLCVLISMCAWFELLVPLNTDTC